MNSKSGPRSLVFSTDMKIIKTLGIWELGGLFLNFDDKKKLLKTLQHDWRGSARKRRHAIALSWVLTAPREVLSAGNFQTDN